MRARDLASLAAPLCLALPPLFADGGGTWVPLAPLCEARQEVGAARIGDKVYVVGGLQSGPLRATPSVEAYDIPANTWSLVAPMPVGLDHMGVAAFGGALYVFGGFSADFAPRAGTLVYDPAGDSWSSAAPMPEPRGACWAVTHGDRIYVFGGVGPGGATASTLVYDPAGDAWSAGAPMPTRREHLNAVSLGAYVYVIGGRRGSAFAVNERYDPALDQWTTLAPMPTARSAMALAAFGGRIHAMGGEIPMLFAVHEVYDPLTDTWTTGPPMPLPRHGIAAVTLDDRIFTPAGGTIQGLQPTDQADAFLPDACPGAVSYCFCERAAPCGNEDPLGGCATSTGRGGLLTGSGSASIAADDLVLAGSRLPPHQNGIAFLGAARIRQAFGDGLLCVGAGGAGIFRFPVRNSGPTGVIVEGPGIVARTASCSFCTLVAGSTWNFQIWFRDPAGPCGSAFNTSSALGVTFAP